MDYDAISNAVKLCGSTPKVDQCKACPYWAEGDMSKCIPKMTKDDADAITDLMKYKEAIDRMGRFGKLFVQYSGDPRGPMGTMFLPAFADKEIEFVLMMEPIEDVEGDKWRPVGEGWLQQLIERTKAAEDRCEMLESANRVLSTRISTAEKMVKEYQDTIVPGYRERAEKASEIASDLCDDFTDFVTGGVHNAAPYCANNRPECVNAHGWCNGDNSVCRGFLPKAAGIKKEE